MLESNSSNKIDMSDFDIEMSSDEKEDFITNSDIVGNMEGNHVSTAGNTHHDKTEGENDEIEDTIVTEGLSLLKRASITTGGFQVTRSGTHQYKNDMKDSYILKYNCCQLYKGIFPTILLDSSKNYHFTMIGKTIGLTKKQNIQGKEKLNSLVQDHIDVLFLCYEEN